MTNPEITRVQRPSFEESCESLKQPVSIPGSIRGAFGKNNIKNLQDLLATDYVVEADAFVMCGKMKVEERKQYVYLLPEYEETEKALMVIVTNMVEELRPKFLSIIKSLNTAKTKDNLFINLIHEMRRLAALLSDAHPAAFYRKTLVARKILSFFSSLLTLSLAGCLTSEEAKSDFLQAMDKINKEWNKIFNVKYGFVGYRAYMEKISCEEGLVSESGQRTLEAISAGRNLTEDQQKELEAQLFLEFNEIKDLAEVRKIDYTEDRIGQAQVGFYGNNDSFYSNTYNPGFFSFQMSFDETIKLERPLFRVKTSRGYHTKINIESGVLVFNLNRYTGELTFISAEGVSLKTVMAKDQYLFLKQRIFALLLDHLKAKDPDVEDLFAHTANPVRQEIAVIQESAIAASQPNELEGSAEAVEAEELEKLEELEGEITPLKWSSSGSSINEVMSLAAAGPTSEGSNLVAAEKARKIKLLDRIRGIKGKQLFAILERLMGPPVKISKSSHYFFRGFNNQLFPIPFHAEGVKFPLLRKCLIQWDIPLEKFCESI